MAERFPSSRVVALVLAASAMNGMAAPGVWKADQGDGTYKNPVPDAIRVGRDFYMTASSFNTSPGLPILGYADYDWFKIE